MEFKKKKFINKASTITLGIGLVASTITSPILKMPSIVHAATTSNAESILANMTPAQKEALKQVSLMDQSGLYLDKTVNLNSSDKVKVIAEFKHKPQHTAVLEAALDGKDLSDTQAKKDIDTDHSTFKNYLPTIFKNKDAGTYNIIREYKTAFSGVAVELPANKINDLLQSGVVNAIYSDAQVQLEKPSGTEEATTESTGQGMAAERSYLNVDKLHDEGFTGKGVKVAVIDTGIDYNHPDITDAYKGYRAQPGVDPKTIDPNTVKGWDFVDNDADPMETTYDDWVKAGKPGGDYLSYVTEHGTHVSGIIAGQGKANSPLATTGVAPDADLYVYRVLGPGGSGADDAIIGGIDKAVSDGVDIMNLSLGANYNNPLTLENVAINNAVLSGVVATIAAGNAGDGMYTLGTPGNSPLALTVGASDVPSDIPTMTSTMSDTNGTVSSKMHLLANDFDTNLKSTFEGKTYPIVDVSLGQSWNFWQPGNFYKDKVVLIQRGTNTINDKILQALNKQAKAVIMWDNNPNEDYMPFYLGQGKDFIPSFNISNKDGLALKAKIAAEEKATGVGTATITFSNLGNLHQNGDNIAAFSSRGPSNITYDIKPEVTAPGVSVLSTVPGFLHSPTNPSDYKYAYDALSGTSMATPFTAGVAALLLQAHPDLKPDDVKAILMNTADPLSKTYSVYEEGAGRVDPYRAIHSDFEIKVQESAPTIMMGKEKLIKEDTGALSFGDEPATGKEINESRSITLVNKANVDKTFAVSVQFQTGLRGSKDAAQNNVTVKTDETMTVKSNNTLNRKVSLDIPNTAETGIYEGYIVFKNQQDPSESYRIPFAVHYVQEGLTIKNATNTDSNIWQYQTSQIASMRTSSTLTVNSHMDNIYAFVEDASTGKDIGYLGSIDGYSLKEGVPFTGTFFAGYYYPIVDEKNGVVDLNETTVPKNGLYKIKLVGYNHDGKSFTSEAPFYSDGVKPDYDLKVDGETDGNPFIEYDPGKNIPITATIHDDAPAELAKIGIKQDQSKNMLYASFGEWPFGIVPINGDDGKGISADGKISDSIDLTGWGDYTPVRFEGTDEATNGGGQKQVYFVKKGKPYVVGLPNAATKLDALWAKPGDNVTYTLTAHNVSNVQKAVYKFTVNPGTENIQSIALSNDAKNLGATLSTVTSQSGNNTNYVVTVTFDPSKPANGNVKMVDVSETFLDPKVTGDYGDIPYFANNTGVSSTFTDVNNVATYPYTRMVPAGVFAKTSEVNGYIGAEGFFDKNWILDPNIKKNITDPKFGVKVTVIDKQGNQYPMTSIKSSAIFTVAGIPATTDDLFIKQEIPGYFTTYHSFQDDAIFFGEVYGIGYQMVGPETMKTAAAGDVNGDNVIDINDALAIQASWGAHMGDKTYNRNADINYDGVVDATDFAFVEKNYLMQNPAFANVKKPDDKYKGKTLQDIKNELGIK